MIMVIDHQQLDCMATAVYHEARGESESGRKMVAAVIKNRSKTRGFPNSFCGVIKQTGQFTYDPKRGTMDKHSYEDIYKMVVDIAYRDSNIDENVLYYHNTSVNPRWARAVKLYKKVGRHVFYKRVS